MRIHVTVTSCASPSAFAASLRAKILNIEPDADVRIRVIPAPAFRRLQAVDAVNAVCGLVELVGDFIGDIRSELEPTEGSVKSDASLYAQGGPARAITAAEVASALAEGYAIRGEYIEGGLQLFAVSA